jgi:hypothetical protein
MSRRHLPIIGGLFNRSVDKFDVFLKWLHDLGGHYKVYIFESKPRDPKRYQWPPKFKVNRRPLDPKKYRTDESGVVRKIPESVQIMDENFKNNQP